MSKFATMRRHRWDVGGFTLTEMLATVLIMTLVATIMATGIPAAANSYRKVINTSNAQLALSTTLNVMRGEIGASTDVRVAAEDPTNPSSSTAIFYLGSDGYWASISNPPSGGYRGLIKKYYVGTPDGYSTPNHGVTADFIGTALSDDRGSPLIYPLVSNAAISDTRDSLSVSIDVSSMGTTPLGYLTISEVGVNDSAGNVLASATNYSILLCFK